MVALVATSLAEAAAPRAGAAPRPVSRVVLAGNGIDGTRFGQGTRVVVAELDRALGRPVPPVERNEAGNCTVDAAVRWPELKVYFFHGHFVGYSTLSPGGRLATEPDIATTRGLRVGDTLAKARAIYGGALRTSAAQGGSWSATTPEGAVKGYLTGEATRTGPMPRVLSTGAGAVGCPAASP